MDLHFLPPPPSKAVPPSPKTTPPTPSPFSDFFHFTCGALEGGGGKKCKCCSYRGGCVEVDMWVCYVKWKKSEKGDGVGGVVLGEGGTALEGGGGKKCK